MHKLHNWQTLSNMSIKTWFDFVLIFLKLPDEC